MLFFMFLSSFLHKIGCYRRKTPILGAKLVKISHTRKYFPKKMFYTYHFSPFVPFPYPFLY